MKLLITRINVISLYIIINLLMAQVTTALPFHLWDLSCGDGTLKVSLAKRQPKATNNNIKGDTVALDKLSYRNKNIWEQLSQKNEDESANKLTEDHAMLTANDFLQEAAISEAAKNVTRDVQAAGVSLKTGIRLPTLTEAAEKFSGDAELISPDPYERQTRKILPKIESLERTTNEYDDDDEDEKPIENIESFLAELDDKYGTKHIVNEIVQRVLKETPTTNEEKEAAAESERFKKLKMESAKRNKGEHQHLQNPKDEEETDLICTMKCKPKAYSEKPKEEEDTVKVNYHEKKLKEPEIAQNKNCHEKPKDNEMDLDDDLNKETRKKPKFKTKILEDDKLSGGQIQNNPFQLKCQTTHYETLRNELDELSAKKNKGKLKKYKGNSAEKCKIPMVTSNHNNNNNDNNELKSSSPSKSKTIEISTDEPFSIEEPTAEDNTKETITEESVTEKSKSAEDHVETDSKDRNKIYDQKSDIEEYIDNGEEQKDLSTSPDYDEQLENPIKVDRNIPNDNAKAHAIFSKILNYENEDWYKRLLSDGKNTKKPINLSNLGDKFKKSLSLNIAEPLQILPKKYHTIKISGKLTEEDEERDDREDKEKKQKDDAERQLKETQEKEQLKEKQKAQPKHQANDQLKDQTQLKEQPKLQQKVQLKDQPKEQIKVQQKYQPKEQLKVQLKPQVKDSIKEQPKDQLKEQPKEQLKEQIKEQPKEQLKDQQKEQDKEENDKDKDSPPSETLLKPTKTGDDEEDSDYFTNFPVKTARIMLLKTINAEILELEAIRNRTMLEFKNSGNETISTTTEATTTEAATTEETTTEAATTESTPIASSSTECIEVTTTEEPTTTALAPAKMEINCDNITKLEYSTFKPPLTVESLPVKKTSAAAAAAHAKTNKKTAMEASDGVLFLPLTKFDNNPSESLETLKRLHPRHIVNNEETKEEANTNDEYDDEDNNEDENNENIKLQTRRENQEDDYDKTTSEKDDEELELKICDNPESPAKITVVVGKNEKSNKNCDDNADESDGDSETKKKDGNKKVQIKPVSSAAIECKKVEGSSNDNANNIVAAVPAPKVEMNSQCSLEKIIKVSDDFELPNTKMLALQDLRSVKSGVAMDSPPRLTGVIPPREFSSERELFRIMAGLAACREKSSKTSSSDGSNEQEECKKTVKQPEKRFTIF